MTSECGVNRRREDPELRDIDHDEHDQPCLPNCGLSCSRPRFHLKLHFSPWPRLVRHEFQLRSDRVRVVVDHRERRR